jgi:hypothetical protein
LFRPIENYDFNIFFDVSALAKILDKFGKIRSVAGTWESPDKGRAITTDALAKVSATLGNIMSSIPAERHDERSEAQTFPSVEVGKVYSAAYANQALQDGQKVVYAPCPPPIRKILRLHNAESRASARSSSSGTTSSVAVATISSSPSPPPTMPTPGRAPAEALLGSARSNTLSGGVPPPIGSTRSNTQSGGAPPPPARSVGPPPSVAPPPAPSEAAPPPPPRR